ncbi:hypothetical protein [Nitratireductor basaltis]|uniref:Uncharacterized protein n=1 Tax=Nitratireductor basaltis TaxID=472175 RepID=A0A084UBN3_9HYPH|nr:hypothetical protein [Nitratireductor basaltis]KFB10369.1 hypothetical protein EL18_01400 [Nitratireductor basaltis]
MPATSTYQAAGAALSKALNGPSLAELEASLHHAERELFCADYIDNTERAFREKAHWRKRVADLKAQIAERRAS